MPVEVTSTRSPASVPAQVVYSLFCATNAGFSRYTAIFSFPGDEEGEAFNKKDDDGDDARDQRGKGVIALIYRVEELENGQLTLGVDEKDDGARRRHAAREVIDKAA